MHRNLRAALLPTTAALALVIAGCGSDNNNEKTSAQTTPTATTPATTAPATTTPAAAASAVTIKMSEFAFDPKEVTVKAGRVKITTPNVGKVEHELVLMRTKLDPGKLPTPGGEVDEENTKGATVVGEIADVAAGATKTKAFRLKAGTYAMICNLPGHYVGGMWGKVTVE